MDTFGAALQHVVRGHSHGFAFTDDAGSPLLLHSLLSGAPDGENGPCRERGPFRAWRQKTCPCARTLPVVRGDLSCHGGLTLARGWVTLLLVAADPPRQ